MATLSFSVTVPDAKQVEILDYFARNLGWSETLPNGSANPETRAQAARRFIVEYVKSNYRTYKIRLDTEAARSSASTTVDGISIT